ncbi:hypothetical protein [Streptomyces europaeiscabiei]|uniref:hypothetical protein n=1 Tax=Streptomyces europaeiscabiei TaxID=146819 RepID=UPI002E139A45|nr:hypothetical protein OHB30_02095 [Streptomyces europaeiscabiei]
MPGAVVLLGISPLLARALSAVLGALVAVGVSVAELLTRGARPHDAVEGLVDDVGGGGAGVEQGPFGPLGLDQGPVPYSTQVAAHDPATVVRVGQPSDDPRLDVGPQAAISSRPRSTWPGVREVMVGRG